MTVAYPTDPVFWRKEKREVKEAKESNGTAMHGKTPFSIKEDHKIICGVLDQEG